MLRACPVEEARALARELGVSEITAGVLVRRGYADPADAAAFLAGEQAAARSVSARRHAAGGRADPRRDRSRRADLRARRLRRRRHLRNRAGGADAARSGADVVWHLPSRFEEGYGVSGETIARLAEDGIGLVVTVDCGITAVEEVGRGQVARSRRDRHGSPPSRRDAPRLPRRRNAAVGVSVPRALRHRGRAEARAGASRASSIRRSTRHLDLVALATIADVVPLVDENRSLATAGLRALALHEKARSAGADADGRSRPRGRRHGPGRVPARPTDQCRREAGAARCRARVDPHRGRCRGSRAGRAARGAEPRAPGGRGPHPARGDSHDRSLAGAAPAAARLRRLGRGLARRRDRHRGVAARRAVQPARRARRRRRRRRLEGLGPLDPRVRPARRSRRLRGASRALRRSSRRCRTVDPARPGSRRSRKRSRRTPTRR